MRIKTNQFNSYPCPLCSQDDYLIAPFSLSKFDDGMAGIFICRHCGMTPYVSTFSDRYEQMMKREYYDQGHYNFSSISERKHKYLSESLQITNQYKPLKGARLLDVGCGQGRLLENAATLGAQIKGIEPSVTEATKLQDQGFDVFCGMLDEYKPEKSESWDIIYMVWLLDAMKDPVKALKIARNNIAKDGVLSILLGTLFGERFFSPRLPGIGGISYPRIKQKPLYGLLPMRSSADTHPFHFTQKSLFACLAVSGFEVVFHTNKNCTHVIARPTEPKKLSEIPVEDSKWLKRYFFRWKVLDLVIRPYYTFFFESFLPSLPRPVKDILMRIFRTRS